MTYGMTDSAYASGGYQPSYQGSNGYPNAIYGLTGPGSTAYLQYGNYSSYAYEGYYGGIYAESTTQFDGGYTIDIRETTDYGSTSYDHEVSLTAHDPPTYYGAYSYGANAGGGYDGYGYGYSGYGVIGHYTSATFETSYSGDVETISSWSVAETTYAGGTYAYQISSMSGEYENGMPIPGSANESSVSGTGYTSYGYGYGYTS